MAEYMIQEATLTDIADAIRKRTGQDGGMTPLEMPDHIASIPSGPELPTLNNPAGPSQIYSGYEAIDAAGGLITGAAQTYEDGYAQGYSDATGGVGPPQPLSYVWDEASLTLTITEV